MDKWKKSPREQSRDITENKTKPHHIGKMSFEVCRQELTALRITNPAFRDKKWKARLETVVKGIESIDNSVNKKALQELLRTVKRGET